MAVVNAYDIELATLNYNSALQLLLQQMDSRFRGSVSSYTGYVGKQVSPVQYIGQLAFARAGARGSPLQPQVAQYQRRWVAPADWDLPVHVDNFDLLRSIVDPKGALGMSMMAAANRLFDDIIINAFFSTAQIGVDPSSLTTETFDSGSNFPTSVSVADTFGAGTETGMTAKKIIEGRRILRHYENDMEAMECHLALSSTQEADLLSQVEVISREYRDVPVMEDGKIKRFLGCTMHFSERLPYAAGDSDERLCPMWLTDGMHLGIWKDFETVISQRNDLTGHPWQAYSTITAGATRMQAGKVIKISCLDPVGGPIAN